MTSVKGENMDGVWKVRNGKKVRVGKSNNPKYPWRGLCIDCEEVVFGGIDLYYDEEGRCQLAFKYSGYVEAWDLMERENPQHAV